MAQTKSTDTERAQRADALIARMKEARGYIYPEWEFAARQDPDFVETYNRIYEQGLSDGHHVSAKVREFVAIALLAFRGAEKAGLVAHMKRPPAGRHPRGDLRGAGDVPGAGGRSYVSPRAHRPHRGRRRARAELSRAASRPA